MLVTFKTDSYPDITMFGDSARQMITLMGHSDTVPGAILAADVPAALARLQAGLSAEPVVAATTDDNDDEPVSLSTRALPLVELLQSAAAQNSDVLWDS